LTRFLCFLPEQILFHRDKFEIWRQSKIGAGSETCEAISSFETNIIEFSNKASSENSILCRVRSLVLSLMTGERYANTNLYSNYILLIMKKRLGKLIRFATSMRSVSCLRSNVLSAIVKCSRRGRPDKTASWSSDEPIFKKSILNPANNSGSNFARFKGYLGSVARRREIQRIVSFSTILVCLGFPFSYYDSIKF
jgi:hypothetical protein